MKRLAAGIGRFSRFGRARWLNLSLGLLLVAVLALGYFTLGSADSTAAVSVRTTTVAQGSLTATVTGSGNLVSSRSSALAFGASGTVTSVDVKVGEKVKKGQTLARIDTAAAERTVRAAKAALASAQASYDELVAGQTALAEQSAALQIESAQLGVSSASKSLTSAKAQLAADTKAKAPSATLTKDRDSVTQAEQQLAVAKVQLAQQRATAEKDAAGPTSAQVAQAEVAIQNAQVTVDDAKDALDATKLTAPFAGTVLTVSGEEGDDVSSGGNSTSGSSSGASSSSGNGSASTANETSSSSAGSAFLTMASLSKLDVTASIAEADIGALKVGQEAEVRLSASEETMTGTVSAVSPQGTTSSNVVQYPVTVSISDPVASARLGASVSVTITTGSAENALVLPTSVITTSGSRHTVALMTNGVATTTVVETGLQSSSATEITGGLKAGDVVQIPSTTTTTTSGVPGIGGRGGAGGAARNLGGGGGR